MDQLNLNLTLAPGSTLIIYSSAPYSTISEKGFQVSQTPWTEKFGESFSGWIPERKEPELKNLDVLLVDTGEKDNDNSENTGLLEKMLKHPKVSEGFNINIKRVAYDEIPNNYNDFDLVMLSGRHSHDPAWEDDKTKIHYSWLLHLTKPMLAICGGYQRWAVVLGGKLMEKEDLEEGIPEISLNYGPLNNGIYAMSMMSKHRRFIDHDSLPKEFIIRGKTGKGMAILEYIRGNLIQTGYQGHPERAAYEPDELREKYPEVGTDIDVITRFREYSFKFFRNLVEYAADYKKTGYDPIRTF